MIFLIAFLAFIVRFVPRLLRLNAIDSDTYFHLLYAKAIRENGFHIPKRYPRVILDHKSDYPFLYHTLLALFPIDLREWAERLTPATFDTLSLFAVYLFSGWVQQQNPSLSSLTNLPIWTAIIFALSPHILRLGVGPIYCGSPRLVGQFLYVLHILTAYMAFSAHNVGFLLISLLAGSVLVITAQFSSQVFIFFGILFCLFISPYYFLLILGSLLLSIVLTKGKTLDVLKGHVKHSTYYYQELQHIINIPRIVTLRKYIRNVISALGYLVRFQPLNFLQWYFRRETYYLHLLITTVPQFIVIIFILPEILSLSVNRFLLVWAAAGLVWFFITKYKKFLFLGEGERYLEYALFPSVFLTVQYLLIHNVTIALYIWLGYLTCCTLFYSWQYLNTTIDDFDITERLFIKLNSMPEGVIWPIGWFNWQTVYRAKFPVLSHGQNMDIKHLPLEEFRLVYGNYAFPSEHYREIIERYKVSYIITSRDALDHYLLKIVKQSEGFSSLIEDKWEAGHMLLLKVKQNDNSFVLSKK